MRVTKVLVGRCARHTVRKTTKDFDIATDAHPEQVHKLFRNSILIGRRFRLVHVRFGREIIEVATFRASHHASENSNQAKQAENGMLLRDNVYGTVDDDAMRRDFTINAMYYNINGFTIHDFAGGIEDIENAVSALLATLRPVTEKIQYVCSGPFVLPPS